MADVIFTINGSETSYLAENVEVRRQWIGKRREMADRSNKIFTDGYHLSFRVFSQDLIKETGTADPRTLQTALEDPSQTVTAKVKNTAFEVISTQSEETLFELEFGTRVDPDIIECITKNKITSLTEFEK